MSAFGWVALAILVAAAILFFRKWLPLEVTALSVPIVLSLTGVISKDQALSGFSSEAVLTVAAVFVLGAGLQESGVTTLIARFLERVGGRHESWQLLAVMGVSMAISAFMPNAAAVAILL